MTTGITIQQKRKSQPDSTLKTDALKKLSPNSLYEQRVPYEAVRDWYAKFDDPRSVWRHRIISEAIEYSRRGYVMIMDPRKSKFHREYWEYLQRKHPKIRMREPKDKGSGSHWIILKTDDTPDGVTIDHKNSLGCVDLSFNRTRLERISTGLNRKGIPIGTDF